MTKNLIRLAITTIPIILVIGLVRVNIGLGVAPNATTFQNNYWAVGALTFLFSMAWFINIPLIRFFDRPLLRYGLSYLAMVLLILLLIYTTSEIVFPKNKRFLLHPFWVALIFNTIVIALSNFTLLKTSKDIAEIKLNELKRLQLEAEKKLLVQQLQPHFLFNALSTLKSLINEDQDKASDYTVQLSEFLRYAVTSSKRDTISVQNELDFTKDYIKLQSERFINSVESEICLPSAVLQWHLPVFSLQTLVENAFKHNLLSPEKPLGIKIWFEDGMINVQNSKNQALYPVDSMGTGLKNLNERFQIITGSSIIIEDKEETFTVGLIPIKT